MNYFQLIREVLTILPALIRAADDLIPGEQQGLKKLQAVMESILVALPEAQKIEGLIKAIIGIFIAKQKT